MTDAPVRIAVLIPCYNEKQTIGNVVRSFQAQLPDAAVYVFDNDSDDQTAKEARQAGAIVRCERRRGKGYVLHAMFGEVEADIYVMVDGDGTYPADKVHALIAPVAAGEADMVIGSRLHPGSQSQFTMQNWIGNQVVCVWLQLLFRVRMTDVLSGYRVMNKRVVKGLPFLSRGFESETELTVKCLENGLRVFEVPVNLIPRPPGSFSKIRFVRDGLIILSTLFRLARDYKPLMVFGSIGLSLVGGGLVSGSAVIREFLATGQVLRVPLAILSTGFVLAGLLAIFAGLVLHTVAQHFQELNHQLQKLLEYQFRPPADPKH